MLEDFIAEARASSGGAERSNYQIFVQKLCAALDVAPPGMAGPDHERNDYVFERRVDFHHPDGTTTPGYIDCYKRDHFILEAKQSKRRQISDAPARKRARLDWDRPGWDRVMAEARRQAENYARALPVDHGYPPFLITVDVGQAIEVFADFSGLGKNYAHFPDRNSYRITLEDLRRDDVRKRLRTIFTAPRKLDPTRHASRVTRVIAARLARVARRLEKRHDPAEVAQFLMRCLFTMFAEDSGLLPERGVGGVRVDQDVVVPDVDAGFGGCSHGVLLMDGRWSARSRRPSGLDDRFGIGLGGFRSLRDGIRRRCRGTTGDEEGKNGGQGRRDARGQVHGLETLAKGRPGHALDLLPRGAKGLDHAVDGLGRCAAGRCLAGELRDDAIPA